MNTNSDSINGNSIVFNLIGWAFGVLVFAIGIANLLWVHPVPGIAYLLISLVYFPPANVLLKEKTGFAIPGILKIGLGIILIMFTLGVSDLGDMIDKRAWLS